MTTKRSKLKEIMRNLTRRFWEHEIQVAEGVALLENLEMNPRAMEVRIKTTPGLKEHMALCMAEMLGDAPNYTELKFDLVAHKSDRPEWITVTIRRDNGKTPHQLRQEAEAKVVEMQKEIDSLRTALENSKRRVDAIWKSL